jgi:hypothetical protein
MILPPIRLSVTDHSLLKVRHVSRGSTSRPADSYDVDDATT